jgi:hypothetical protein
MKIVRDCITGIDGVTVDPARVYLLLAVVVFLGGAVTELFFAHKIDFQAYGIGFGALLAGGGFGIGAKSKTEPKQS